MKNKELKPYIWTITALFFGFILRGYLTANQYPEESEKIISGIIADFNFLEKINPFLLFIFIFLNNSIKTLLVILLGFLFGIAPLFFIIFNGFIIGIITAIIAKDSGIINVLAGTLPHGILEIPAAILASAYGLWLGVKFYNKLRKKDSFKKYFIFALKKYIKIIVPMLLGAAFIEAFITPLFI